MLNSDRQLPINHQLQNELLQDVFQLIIGKMVIRPTPKELIRTHYSNLTVNGCR